MKNTNLSTLSRVRQSIARVTTLGVLAVVALTASLTVAYAQTEKPAEPPAVSFENFHPGNGAGFADKTGAVVHDSSSVGWYFVHPTNCLAYSGYLYVYTKEGYYFYTNNATFQQLIETDCQTGNYLGFYVTNTTFGWDEVYTYQYK